MSAAHSVPSVPPASTTFLRHRPQVPSQLSALLSFDYVPKGARSIPLPVISKPPAPVAPDSALLLDQAALTKQHFEIVLWLAVFACTRESPARAVVAMDVPRGPNVESGGGLPRHPSSPASRSGSPGGAGAQSSFGVPPPNTMVHAAGRSASPLPLTNHSIASLAAYSATGSERGANRFDVGDDAESADVESAALTTVLADLPLTVTSLQCQTIIRCVKIALGLHGGVGKADPLGFTADALQRWIAAPQQFGPNIKRLEDVMLKAPQQRRRRDAVYRNLLTRLLGDPVVVDFLWWCAGQFNDIYWGTAFPLYEDTAPTHGGHSLANQSLSSSVSTLKGEEGKREQCGGGTPSIASGARGTKPSCALGSTRYASLPHELPSLADLHRADERRDVASMLSALLWQYIEGGMEWVDCAESCSTIAAVNKSIHSSGVATPSLPPLLLRTHGASLINVAALVSLSLVRCGLSNLSGLDACVSLQVLRLHGNRVACIPPALWAHLAALRELDVSSNLLTCLGFEHPIDAPFENAEGDAAAHGHGCSPRLRALVHLEALHAAFNDFTEETVASWWTMPPSLLPALKHWDLSGNRALRDVPLCLTDRGDLMLPLAPSLQRLVLLQTAVRRVPVSGEKRGGGGPHLTVVFPAEMPTSKYHATPGVRQWRSLKAVLDHILNVVFLFREARRMSTSKRINQLLQQHLSTLPSARSGWVEDLPSSARSAPLCSRVQTRLHCDRVLRRHLAASVSSLTTAAALDTHEASTTSASVLDDVSPALSRLLGRKRLSSLRLVKSSPSMRK